MGTSEGGVKASKTNMRLYGKDFYQRIGALGGKKSRGGGFTDRALARRAGAIGGRRSKRPKRAL